MQPMCCSKKANSLSNVRHRQAKKLLSSAAALAGLACAHKLAEHGHSVTIFEFHGRSLAV